MQATMTDEVETEREGEREERERKCMCVCWTGHLGQISTCPCLGPEPGPGPGSGPRGLTRRGAEWRVEIKESALLASCNLTCPPLAPHEADTK